MSDGTRPAPSTIGAKILTNVDPSTSSLTRRVAFQGERGAFSEEAVIREFGRSAEPIPFPTLSRVFESVENGETDAAVVPVENSLEGSINETYDLLLHTKLSVTGEAKLRIRQHLISKPVSTLGQIRKIYSHPQALAQCRLTLSKLGIQVYPFFDTAGSVKHVAESRDESIAAIASSRAAQIYGMKILIRGIEDLKTNHTRFLILGQAPLKRVRGTVKTSLIFTTKHQPGSLHRALGAFAHRRINLTKIESRPTKHTPWEYYFYIDLEGTANNPQMKLALADLSKRTDFVKVLGSYPAALA